METLLALLVLICAAALLLVRVRPLTRTRVSVHLGALLAVWLGWSIALFLATYVAIATGSESWTVDGDLILIGALVVGTFALPPGSRGLGEWMLRKYWPYEAAAEQQGRRWVPLRERTRSSE